MLDAEMKIIRSFETSGNYSPTKRRHMLEDLNLELGGYASHKFIITYRKLNYLLPIFTTYKAACKDELFTQKRISEK
jgi:hypothetical protein